VSGVVAGALLARLLDVAFPAGVAALAAAGGVAAGAALPALLAHRRRRSPDVLAVREARAAEELARLDRDLAELVETRRLVEAKPADGAWLKARELLDLLEAREARRKDRLRAELCRIEAVRWQNGVKALTSGWADLAPVVCRRRRERLEEVRRDGEQMRQRWRDAFPASDRGAALEAQLAALAAALGVCAALDDAFVARAVTLAARGAPEIASGVELRAWASAGLEPAEPPVVAAAFEELLGEADRASRTRVVEAELEALEG
jgi:hypothetical protein